MGLYTSIYIYPADFDFSPTEENVIQLFDFLGISKIEIAAGYQSDEDGEEQGVFRLKNVDLEEAFKALKKYNPQNALFLVSGEYLKVISESILKSVSKEMADDFLPWETGLNFGPWEVTDEDSEVVIASGKFYISKSASGCPKSLNAYLTEFNENLDVLRLISFLKEATGMEWRMLIKLS